MHNYTPTKVARIKNELHFCILPQKIHQQMVMIKGSNNNFIRCNLLSIDSLLQTLGEYS